MKITCICLAVLVLFLFAFFPGCRTGVERIKMSESESVVEQPDEEKAETLMEEELDEQPPEQPEEPQAEKQVTAPLPDPVFDHLADMVTQEGAAKAVGEYLAITGTEDVEVDPVLYAELLIAAGKYFEAEKIIIDALESRPENPELWYSLSLVAAFKGDHGDEQTYLGKTVELDPDNGYAHAGYGKLLFNREGNISSAEFHLSRAAELVPDYPYIYIDRFKIRQALGDLTGAEEDINRAVLLDPGNYWNYLDRGRFLLQSGRLEEAESDFSEAIRLDGELFFGYILRASVYESLGQYGPASEDQLKVLAARPDYFQGILPLAENLFKSGKWKDAAGMFQKAFSYNRDNLFLPFFAAAAFYRGGLEKKAAAYLTDLIVMFPQGTLLYDMVNYFIKPAGDEYLLNKILLEKDIGLRTGLLFFLGELYLVQDRKLMAQTCFLECIEYRAGTDMIGRLAEQELSGLMQN
jgi:tetratricopeptide (TPR) repeat protein